MKTRVRLTVLSCTAVLSAIVGCGGSTAPDSQMDGMMVDMMQSDDVQMDDGTVQPTGGWSQVSAPCEGSRTNAVWFDDRDNGFLGVRIHNKGCLIVWMHNEGLSYCADPK